VSVGIKPGKTPYRNNALNYVGIAQKRVGMIEKAWVAQKAIKEVMILLRGLGVSTTYAVKIYK